MDDGKNPVEKLAYIVSQRKLCNVYEEFLVSTYSWENFGFLLDVERYQELETQNERREMAKIIFEKFMEEDSLFTLGDVLPEVKDQIYKRLEDAPPKLFNGILRRTTMALAHSTMSDFETSEVYQQYLAINCEKEAVELRYDHIYKIILTGSSNVGKSSILTRHTKSKFDGDRVITQGPEFECKVSVVAGKAIKTQIWDTSGQEKFFNLTRGYYRNAFGVILVYDITENDSFRSLETWLQDIKEFAPDAVIALIGNKCDKNPRKITNDEGSKFAQDNGIDVFLETSALDGTNIGQLFDDLLYKIYQKQKVGGGAEYQFEHSRIALEEEETNTGCSCLLL